MSPKAGNVLPFEIRRQLDDTTCGPVCLHAIYRYFDDEVPLDRVISEVVSLPLGGTLGVALGNHALARGYRVRLVTWNLQIFDPTWFNPGARPLRESLLQRAQAKPDDARISQAVPLYVEFLERGGRLEFRDLTPKLIRRFLRTGVPVLTGLSSTFLYRDPRDRPADNVTDDIAGDPVGHFVVLTGYTPGRREVLVSDPQHPNPLSETHTYPLPIERLIGAIYLGVLTYDGNLLVIRPAKNRGN